MLRRFALPFLLPAVAISLACPLSSAQKPPTDKGAQKPVSPAPAKSTDKSAATSPEEQLYQRATELLDRLKKAIEERKSSLHGFVGKECIRGLGEKGCDSPDWKYGNLTQASLDQASRGTLENLSKARKALDDAHQAMLQKKMSPDDFVKRAYREVEFASRPDWIPSDEGAAWPLLVVQVLRAPAKHAQERADAEYNKSIEGAWSKPDYKDIVAAAEGKRSEALKISFKQAAGEFPKLMKLLKEDRKSMVLELWCFQQFADKLSKSTSKPVSDLHARGANDIGDALQGQYEFEHFSRYGPLIVFQESPQAVSEYDWLKTVTDTEGYTYSQAGSTTVSLYSDYVNLPSAVSLHGRDCPGVLPTPKTPTKVTQERASGAREGERP